MPLKEDCSVRIASAKAKELGVSTGDIVVLVGRRRHATYAKVEISKGGKKSSCVISQNMAYNLRLRQDDKVKLVVLEKSFENEEASERSGDLRLVQKQPSLIQSITFSPIEDSLSGLVALEGGDEIPDQVLQARFVSPYLENCENAVLKQGHLLQLRDDNGRRLDFYVSHVSLDVPESDSTSDEVAEGMPYTSYLSGVC